MLFLRKAQVSIAVLLFVSLCSTRAPAAAEGFTFGLKGWNSTLSSDNLDGEDDLFVGANFSWQINDLLWVSAGYLEGETGFSVTGGSTEGFLREIDWDFVMGWSLNQYLDVGVGYRFAQFETVIADITLPVGSEGPMVYVGGSGLFGDSPWGYYWAGAYMFEDLEEEDGSQEHINAEAGALMTSEAGFTVLVGYRYKTYSGDGIDGATFQGPVLGLSFRI